MKLCVCANSRVTVFHAYRMANNSLPCICTPKLNSDVILNVVFTMARPPGHKIVVYRNGTSTAKVFSVVLRTCTTESDYDENYIQFV